MRTYVVALSGGLDSATLLALIEKQIKIGYGGNSQTISVGFTYGSKHNQWENEAARRIAAHYNTPFFLIDLTTVFAVHGNKSALLLSGGDIPEGHYEDESMKKTVVPGRNLIFASVLASIAESYVVNEKDSAVVSLGIHAGDHAIYPDCRPAFLRSLYETIRHSSKNKVIVEAPFLRANKADIVKAGLEMKVPYHLTRTCYKESRIACGKCGSCVERTEAFAANAYLDPIPYDPSPTAEQLESL